MKKFLLSLVIVAVSISLVGIFSLSSCTTGGAEETTAAEVTATETTAAEVTAAETTAAEQINLLYWTVNAKDSLMGQWEQWCIDEFQKQNPNIKIEVEVQPAFEMQTMIQTLMAAKSGPDILQHWQGLYLMPFKDYLVDFKDYVTQDQIDAVDSRYLLTTYYMYDLSKPLIGWPVGGAGFHYILYNKAMFRDAGITWEPTEENKYRMKWDEFLDACNKLKSAGYTPLGWGNAGGGMSTWYWDSGTLTSYLEKDDYIKVMTGEMKFNDPKYVNALTRVKELVDAGYFNEGGLTLGWGEGVELVMNEEVAMQNMHTGMDQRKRAYEKFGDDMGMMLWPVCPGQEENPVAYSLRASVPGRNFIPVWSKYPNEAAQFCSFLTSIEAAAKQYELTGTLNGNKDYVPTDFEQDPTLELVYKWLDTYEFYPPPDTMMLPEIFAENQGKSIELWNDEITPQQFCDALADRFSQLDYEWITFK